MSLGRLGWRGAKLQPRLTAPGPFLRIFLARSALPSLLGTPRLPGPAAATTRTHRGQRAAAGLRAPRRSQGALPREGRLLLPPAAPAQLLRAPLPARAAGAVGTYLPDKVTRPVRPGGRPRVSGARERAGRRTVRRPPLLPSSPALSSSALPPPGLPSARLPALRQRPAPPAAPRVLERGARGSGGSPGQPGARAWRQPGGAWPSSPWERIGCGETPPARAYPAGWARGVPGRATGLAKPGDTRAEGGGQQALGEDGSEEKGTAPWKAATNFAPS